MVISLDQIFRNSTDFWSRVPVALNLRNSLYKNISDFILYWA